MMAESFCQITKSKKTINESLNHITEVKKTMAKIAGSLSNRYTNKDQFIHRASQ